MDKSLRKNYVYNLFYRILLVATQVLITPYLSRVLYADGIGQVSFAESIVSYFCLFANLGIGTFGQREISYHQDNKVKYSEIFWNAFTLKFITSMITLIVYALLSLVYFHNVLYLALSLNIIAVLLDITWFFQGLEEFGKIVLRNSIIKLLNIVFIFTFIKSKDDILLYAFSIGFFAIVSNLSLYFYLNRFILPLKIDNLKPFSNFGVYFSLFIPTIAIQIYTVLDKTMIGVITKSNFENGYYDVSVNISKALLTLITSLSLAIIPRIGLLYSRKEQSLLNELMYGSYRFVWMMGVPLSLGLIAVSGNFVPWFLGPGFDKAITLINILSLLIIAIGINNITGAQYLITTERQNLYTLSVILGAILNFLLNLFLIYKFESIGAAIASVIAEFFIAIFQLYIVRKEISIKRIIYEGKNYYIAGAAMFIIVSILARNFRPILYNTLILVVVGATIYFSILLYFKDTFLLNNIHDIIAKLKNRTNK